MSSPASRSPPANRTPAAGQTSAPPAVGASGLAALPAGNLHLVRRLLALARQYRWGCVWLLSLQGLILLFGLAGLGLTGVGIDAVLYHARAIQHPPLYPFGLRPPAHWTPLAEISAIATGILLAAAVRGWLNYLYAVASGRLVHEQIVVDLRARVYDRLQRLSFRFFDDNTTGSIMNRVTSDVQAVRSFIDGVMIQVVLLLLSLVCYLAYMLRIDAGVTFACLATTPLLWTLTTLFSRSVRPLYDRTRELADRVVLTLAETIQGVQVVKGFGREPEEVAKFGTTVDAVEQHQQAIFWRVSLFTPTIGFLTQFNMVVLLAYGGWLVTQDRLPLGTGLVVFAGLLTQFANQVASLTNITNSVQQSLSAARRVFEVLDAPVEIASPAQPLANIRLAGAVEFDAVSFHYQPDAAVLQQLSFQVQPGQRVALLGQTGAGKTTLLSLIPRFYDPTAGRVLIDGHDLREFDVAALRRQVGIVFQETFLFSNTIAANIAFGRPDVTREDIERAARVACAHEFIEQLPQGYDTPLGEWGFNLSGGQRQRLAIARAVLLDPRILLLDDPAAAIDPETEQEILEALDRAMEGRTTFIVAHRLSTLRRADWVLVLDRGQLVQAGSPADLLQQPGYYREAALEQGLQRLPNEADPPHASHPAGRT
jgi:ATP-binding cassette subfamily B protein